MKISRDFSEQEKIEIGERLHEARKRSGLSQRKMAAMMGYNSATVISNKEKGRTSPSLEDLRFLSSVSGLSIEWLVTGKGDNQTGGICCQDKIEAWLLTEYRRMDQAQKASVVFHIKQLTMGEMKVDAETS